MSEQWALVRNFEVAGPTQAQLYGIVLRTIRDTDQSLISDSRYFWGRSTRPTIDSQPLDELMKSMPGGV